MTISRLPQLSNSLNSTYRTDEARMKELFCCNTANLSNLCFLFKGTVPTQLKKPSHLLTRNHLTFDYSANSFQFLANSSVIRQKGESQDGGNKAKLVKFSEKRIFLTPSHTYVVCNRG